MSLHSTHTTEPNRKYLRLAQEAMQLFYLSKGKKRFLLAQSQLSQWEAAVTQAMTNHCPSNLQFPPVGSSSTAAPPPQVQKEHHSPWFHWTCAWFTIRPYASNCSSLLFLSKTILLEKYLAICFKVNVMCWLIQGSREDPQLRGWQATWCSHHRAHWTHGFLTITGVWGWVLLLDPSSCSPVFWSSPGSTRDLIQDFVLSWLRPWFVHKYSAGTSAWLWKSGCSTGTVSFGRGSDSFWN